MEKRYAIAGGIAAALIGAWVIWEAIKKNEARDRLDDILIAGAEAAGRPNAAQALREARDDDNTISKDEWLILALAVITGAIIAGYVGFGFAGPEGAVIGIIIGMVGGALGAVAGLKHEEAKKRAAAEVDILIPAVPEIPLGVGEPT